MDHIKIPSSYKLNLNFKFIEGICIHCIHLHMSGKCVIVGVACIDCCYLWMLGFEMETKTVLAHNLNLVFLF